MKKKILIWRKIMKKKILIWGGIALGSLWVIIIVIYATLNSIAGSKIRSELEKLKANGRAMTIAEIIHVVPDNENSVIELRQAFNLISKGGDYQKGSLKKIYDKVLSDKTIKNISDISKWENQDKIKEILLSKKTQKTFDLVSLATDKPALDFDLNYSEGPGLLLPHLGSMRSIVLLLCIKAMLEANDGNRAQAYLTFLTAFKTSNLLKAEPLLISQLVQLACDKNIIKCVKRTVKTYGILDNDARMLLAELEKRDPLKNMARAMDGERILMGHGIFEKIIEGNVSDEMQDTFAFPANFLLTIGKPVFKLDYAAYLSIFSKYQKWNTMPFWEINDNSDHIGDVFIKDIPKYCFLTRKLAVALGNIRKKVAKNEEQITECKMILLLYMYKNKHSKFPPVLNDLKPDFLKEIPVNPFSGKEFNYQTKNDSFRLK